MRDKLRTAALAAVLIGWSVTTPRIPLQWNPIPHAVFGTSVSLAGGAPHGLRPPELWAGLRWGAAVAAPVALAVAAGTVIRPVRAGMAERTLPASAGHWLLLRIPVGTVWTEEVAYRAALGTVAKRAFGAPGGRLVAAAVFGLSHVTDARAAGQPVSGTVLVTAAAGWVFDWLYAKSGSLAAPMLAHLAVNEAGAVGALAVQRRRGEGEGISRRFGRGRRAGAVRWSGRRSRS
ncbi:Rv0804 family intramembrane glutamic endopeptidase [Mycolicibacterium hippocampi]|uniref:Rv0804 family intramembrane glutamic endopeptidase n=1 Tax=Mycolicibacterium hippocampi TaxID=659824 RepID=UPI0013D437AD|nr:CPBP family intramembrane glutamic endopeptidase [Mycolicibacterium hippocampi]